MTRSAGHDAGQGSHQAVGEAVAPDQIRASVERILASEQFRRSARLSAMLRYLVEHTLTRDGTPLKEYRIGVEVFGRDPDYDTRIDPIVRVEMRRLRSRLAAYYENGGRLEAIRVDIPRGHYGARFEPRELSVPLTATASVRGGNPSETLPANVLEATSTRPDTARSGRGRAGFLLIAGAMTLVVVTALSWLRDLPPPALSPDQSPGPTRVLVTPIDASSHQAGEGRALVDRLVEALSHLEALRLVVSSPARVASTTPLLPVDGTLEVRTNEQTSGIIELSVRLTETPAGTVVWARTFMLPPAETGAASAVAIRTVTSAIRMRLDPESGQRFIRRGNDDEEAWNLYRKARALANSRDPDALLRSLSLFEQAVTRDPGYALAHAGIADVRGVLLANGLVEPGVGLVAAQEAAARAHALDPSLGEALAHMAFVEGFVNWRWDQALADFRRALALTPTHARSHAWHGQTLLALGRFDEAIDALLRAQRLDPAAASITLALGEAYYYADRLDDVAVQAGRLLQADPQSRGGHYLLARAAITRGDRDAALAALRRFPGELWAEVSQRVVLGDRAAALGRLERDSAEIGRRQPFLVASLYALAGDSDRSLAWLERAVDERQADVASIAIDPPLRPLHDRPEFWSLVARVGLDRHRLQRRAGTHGRRAGHDRGASRTDRGGSALTHERRSSRAPATPVARTL